MSQAPPLDPTRFDGDDDPLGAALDPANVLPRRVAAWAASEPDRPFLEEPATGRSATYGQCWDAVLRWCRILTDAGVGPGTRMATLVPSSIDAHVLWMAAGVLGAYEVPVNPELRGEFLHHQLTDAAVTHAVVRPELTSVIDGSGVSGIAMLVAERDGSSTDGVARLDPAPARLPTPDDVSCVIYTSGTTGASKGVVIRWAQMSANIGRLPRHWLSGDDAVYSPWPMFHITGRSPMVSMTDVGGRVVLREKFALEHFWPDVHRHRCTSTSVGIVAPLLLSQPARPGDADNPLRVVLVGSVNRDSHRFIERFGCVGAALYGSTEMGFPIGARPIPPGDTEITGWLRPGYRCRIVDHDGADVGPGQVGELWLQPPDRRMMLREYLGQPERTAAAIVDGWYRTGDAVRLRERDGAIVFVDRLRDTIRRFGENISASELEKVVLADAEVLECAAVAVPSAITGADVLLVVVPQPGTKLQPADLAARLDQALPRYMRPSHIAVVEELPKTPTNKVRKVGLAASIDLSTAWHARPG